MIHEGTIGLTGGDEKPEIVKYFVRTYERRNKKGIGGGKIYMMKLTVAGETVAEYDKGWFLKPDENIPFIMAAYSIIITEYN